MPILALDSAAPEWYQPLITSRAAQSALTLGFSPLDVFSELRKEQKHHGSLIGMLCEGCEEARHIEVLKALSQDKFRSLEQWRVFRHQEISSLTGSLSLLKYALGGSYPKDVKEQIKHWAKVDPDKVDEQFLLQALAEFELPKGLDRVLKQTRNERKRRHNVSLSKQEYDCLQQIHDRSLSATDIPKFLAAINECIDNFGRLNVAKAFKVASKFADTTNLAMPIDHLGDLYFLTLLPRPVRMAVGPLIMMHIVFFKRNCRKERVYLSM